jgi:hypothetical protein
MSTKYFELLQAKEDGTDGGGKPSPEDVENVLTIKDGEDEVEVTYVLEEDGSFTPEVDEDLDEEIVERIRPQIEEGARTLGATYKERMEQNKAKKELDEEKRKLREEREQFEREKAANQRKAPNRITDDTAKKFWGVDTVAEVQRLQEEDYPAWLAGNAEYQATLVAVKIQPQPSVTDKPRTINDVKRVPKTVEGALGAGGKSKTESENKKFNKWLST